MPILYSKYIKQLFICFFIGLLTTKSTVSKATTDKILEAFHVGVILPLTGPQKEYAKEALDAITIALEHFKNENPRLKKLLKISVADDHSTLQGVEKAFQELLEKKASLFIGSLSNPISLKLASLAEKHQIPHIIPAANNIRVTHLASNIFQGSAIYKWQGTLLARFATQALKKKKAALLFDPHDTYQHDIATAFEKNLLKQHGKMIHKEIYKKADTLDLNKHLLNVLEKKPDVILFPSSALEDVSFVMKVLKSHKSKIPLLGTTTWHNTKLLGLAGKAAIGHYYTVPFVPKSKDSYIFNFVEDFKARTNRLPSSLAAMSYNSLLLAVNSYKNANTTRAKELIRTLQNMTAIKGLMGPMKMNQERFVEHSGIMIEITPYGRKARTTVHPPWEKS